jgi:hypothetical protein
MKNMTTTTSSSSTEYPPGPSPIFPNKLLRQFIRNPIKTLMNIAYTYDDIAHFKLGRRRHIYLLNNPNYIEDVLIRNHKNFIKSRGLQVSKRLLGVTITQIGNNFGYLHRLHFSAWYYFCYAI